MKEIGLILVVIALVYLVYNTGYCDAMKRACKELEDRIKELKREK